MMPKVKQIDESDETSDLTESIFMDSETQSFEMIKEQLDDENSDNSVSHKSAKVLSQSALEKAVKSAFETVG